MTAVTEPPQQSFRIEMLWTDARYRSGFLQVIALMLVMLAVAWVVDNTIRNLEALGKDFDFSFLFAPASYDINQVLIDYTSRSPHWRAALVGMLNTLILAFVGCITCTIIGVIAGVLRLSKNWVVSRLMLVYIEAARNVPLLLQILLWGAIFSETMPAPRDYRGEEPAATLWFDAIAATNRGFYIPRPLFEAGSGVVVGVFVASLIGLFIWNRWRKAHQNATGQTLTPRLEQIGKGFAVPAGLAVAWLFFPGFDQGTLAIAIKAVVALGLGAGSAWLLYTFNTLSVRLAILSVPAVLAFFVMGSPITLAYPELRGFNFLDGEGQAIYLRNSFMALWLALSLYTGAFVAEIVRGGILAVSKGQSEAAAALGLRPNLIMSLVILPQALRIIIPPQISQFLNLTKNTSLAIAIGYMDVTGTLGGITMNQTGREMECMLLLMAFYLVISLTISAVINAYNERVKLKER
ncbi:MAG: ABC transporter permease subunit [Pseudomonadota bacterium]